MSLTRADVEKVSLLARLALSAAETDAMTRQLGDVLKYMELLGEVDTTGVEPLAHPLDAHDVLREDAVRPSLPREEALQNAPSRDDECYRVPAVLGEG